MMKTAVRDSNDWVISCMLPCFTTPSTGINDRILNVTQIVAVGIYSFIVMVACVVKRGATMILLTTVPQAKSYVHTSDQSWNFLLSHRNLRFEK